MVMYMYLEIQSILYNRTIQYTGSMFGSFEFHHDIYGHIQGRPEKTERVDAITGISV